MSVIGTVVSVALEMGWMYRKQAEGHGANELADADGTGHDGG